MPHRFTRRRFLQSAAAAGAFGYWLGSARADDKKSSPNERLQIGVVGTYNRAAENWKQLDLAGGCDIVALCDVDENLAGGARTKFPKAKFYLDYRKMIEAKGLDAVLVATPDHHHALATLTALRAGLHVYCEKPMTHTVQEARLVSETAAKMKRVTQLGTQVHASTNYRRIVELIQSGAIGKVKEAHCWVAISWGGVERPKETEPVPAGLHWDQWLGAAPERPYYNGPTEKKGRGFYHPYNWRSWWDFGGGSMTDMGCHHIDLPFWALKLRHPTKVSAEGSPPHPESVAKWMIVTYDFPAHGEQPPVTLKWYDGGKRPKLFEEGKLPKWGDGTLFVGDKGMLLAGYDKRLLLPEKEFADYKAPEPTIADSIGHHKEWIEACKTGGPTTCNFDYSGALTETVLLGAVAYRTGKPFTWDAKNLKADVPEAEKYIRKEYRKGWSLEG
jgi:predicted dehydrogenase